MMILGSFTLGVQRLEGWDPLDHDSWSHLPEESVQGVAHNDDPPDTDDTITQPRRTVTGGSWQADECWVYLGCCVKQASQ